MVALFDREINEPVPLLEILELGLRSDDGRLKVFDLREDSFRELQLKGNFLQFESMFLDPLLPFFVR